MIRITLVVSIILINLHMAVAAAWSLGETPQMDWNSWNAYKANINSTVVEQVADLFGELGLKAAGYEYVFIDDGWANYSRTEDGYLQANSTTFPEGIEPLADKIHSLDLKLGLYGDSGALTCNFRPGSWKDEERDAQTLSNWGVDYWKYDICDGFEAMIEAPQVRLGTMQKALQLLETDIFYSVCEWGYQLPWTWAKTCLVESFQSK